MPYYKSRRRRLIKWIVLLVVIGALIAFGIVLVARNYYKTNLKPVSGESTLIEFTIKEGATLDEISQTLKDKKLIRNKQIFEQYVRNNGTATDIKAGTYELSPSFGVPEIVGIITEGKIASNLITIEPGVTITQVEKILKNAGYSENEAKAALDPSIYKGHPALVDKPDGANLEGYLYPESFQRTSNTPATNIIKSSLNEMQKQLTPEIRADFSKQGLSTYQAITLASIVENEVSKPEDRRQVAQVFLKRLAKGMMLQSNATDGFPADYDTYKIPGLPPGPISNVTSSSLQAVARPSNTDYLYFVTGKDCVTRFSKTVQEHDSLKIQYGIASPEDRCV